MLDHTFHTPLTILVGLGFPKEIRGVMDAIGYLDEQPAPLRDEAFHAARDACQEALNHDASIEEARNVFCALVRRRGVLVEEMWADPTLAGERDSLATSEDEKHA